MRTRRALLTLIAALLAPAAARADAVRLAPVGSFDSPVYVTAPPGDGHRLFVVEQKGTIRVLKDGTELGAPFLDIRASVVLGDEQGLLSMAFAPDYASSGRFYVDYTDHAQGDIHVVEYRRGADPDRADPASARPVLTQDHHFAPNHNGGQLQFGPDGYLYVGLGDGGNGNDTGAGHNPTIGNGQDLSTQLGKILRIDPEHGSPYAVPPSNPFVGRAGALGQIWDYGLRNPWRFSFDRVTGELWIGDVGQQQWEEVDREPRGAGGLDYGWNRCEGTHLFDPGDAGNPSEPACNVAGMTPPLTDYRHVGARCSITGGYVVRDPSLGSLVGAYVYGDFCSGELWSLRPPAAPERLALSVAGLTSFGEDACEHLYAASQDGGVMRFETGATSGCVAGTPAAVSPRAPALSVRALRRVSRRGRVTLRVRCPRGAHVACLVTVKLRRSSSVVARASLRVPAGTVRIARVRLSAAARRRLSRRGRLVVRITASGRDADRALRADRAGALLRAA